MCEGCRSRRLSERDVEMVQESGALTLSSRRSAASAANTLRIEEDDEECDTNGTMRREAALKVASVAVAMFSNFISGMIYLYPYYTAWLRKDLGVSEGQITIIGNLSQASLGLFVLPLAIFHAQQSRRKDHRPADFRYSLITGLIQSFGMGLVCLFTSKAVRGSVQGNALAAALGIGFLLNGGATASIFSHSCWIIAATYTRHPVAKRVLIAAISFMMGIGALFFSGILANLVKLRPWDLIVLHSSLALVSGVLRCAFLYKFYAPEALAERREALKASMKTPLRREFVSTLTGFWTSALAITVFVSNMVVIGLGSTVNTITGNVLMTTGQDDKSTISLCVFMGVQSFGRALVSILGGVKDSSHWIFVASNTLLVAAFAIPWALGSSFEYFGATSALSGFAFGVAWAYWPTAVSMHFPGGLQRIQMNFGIFLWSVFLGCVGCGVLTKEIVDNYSGKMCTVDEATGHRVGSGCYQIVYQNFMILAVLALGLSGIGAVLTDLRKRERPSWTRLDYWLHWFKGLFPRQRHLIWLVKGESS